VGQTVERREPDETPRVTRVEQVLPSWIAALEARHLADLRVSEVTRALRALSSAYVERRRDARSRAEDAHHKVRGALDTAGKRAAFALFYAPLHFIATARVIAALGADHPGPAAIVDLGCGTGVAGAAWALASSSAPAVLGIDRHRWAVDEARWTYAHLGVRGRSRVADVRHLPSAREGSAFIAAYVLNELGDAARRRVEDGLLAAVDHGARVLVVEPISRAITPWWESTAERVVAIGGRADEWRVPIDLPPVLKLLDRAAGLRHQDLRFRTLFV
jgi:hypothetical protein